MDLIDYSLMVGVHKLNAPIGEVPFRRATRTCATHNSWKRELPFHRRYRGGLLSSTGEEIYYIGVIDFLTTYDLLKRSETFAKRLFKSSSSQSDISCVPPPEYAHRLLSFVKSVAQ